MKTNYSIDELIERYYECDTNNEEEKYLNEYFNSDSVAQHHKYLIPQFRLMNIEDDKLSSDFDERMLNLLNSKQTIHKPIKLKSNNWWKYSAVAALILVIGSYFYFSRDQIVVTGNNNIDETEFAYNETIRALNILSSNMDVAEKNFEKFKIVNEALDKLNKLNYLENLLNSGSSNE